MQRQVGLCWRVNLSGSEGKPIQRQEILGNEIKVVLVLVTVEVRSKGVLVGSVGCPGQAEKENQADQDQQNPDGGDGEHWRALHKQSRRQRS
ncbi:MAG: hypothetical protein U0872_01280 [Planctomycetaceae bacterium]